MSFKRSSGEISLSPPSKQVKSDSNELCILCDEPCSEKQKYLNDEKWEKFRSTAEEWSGLDRYGSVFRKIDWQSGPIGKLWHKACN